MMIKYTTPENLRPSLVIKLYVLMFHYYRSESLTQKRERNKDFPIKKTQAFPFFWLQRQMRNWWFVIVLDYHEQRQYYSLDIHGKICRVFLGKKQHIFKSKKQPLSQALLNIAVKYFVQLEIVDF